MNMLMDKEALTLLFKIDTLSSKRDSRLTVKIQK